jgi:hypothetical protein
VSSTSTDWCRGNQLRACERRQVQAQVADGFRFFLTPGTNTPPALAALRHALSRWRPIEVECMHVVALLLPHKGPQRHSSRMTSRVFRHLGIADHYAVREIEDVIQIPTKVRLCSGGESLEASFLTLCQSGYHLVKSKDLVVPLTALGG